MTWPYEEDFDALTTGNIGGQDSWVNEVNTPEVSTTEDLNGSGKSYKLNGAVGTERARRAVTLTTTGVFYYATKITTSHTSGDGIGPQLRAASNTKYVTFVKFAWDGGLELQYLRDSAPVYVTLASGLSTNTWYILAHEYDTSRVVIIQAFFLLDPHGSFAKFRQITLRGLCVVRFHGFEVQAVKAKPVFIEDFLLRDIGQGAVRHHRIKTRCIGEGVRFLVDPDAGNLGLAPRDDGAFGAAYHDCNVIEPNF